MNVIKHDGSSEPLDLTKFRASAHWASLDRNGNTIKGVSLSDFEMQCKLHMFDGIHTSYLLDVSIKTAYDMSSVRHFGYEEMAKNLMFQRLYKQVFQSTKPYSLQEHLNRNKDLLKSSFYKLEPQLIDFLDSQIDHSRDFNFTASGIEKTIGSDMLLRNGVPIETPQLMYMTIAMDAMLEFGTEKVIELYNDLSSFKITLPTPELKALRTNSTDYASCCTIRIGDNLNSWTEGSKAIVMHTAASAGVGVDIADIASVGDKVKKGQITHSGKIPIIKSIDTDIGKASQNGRRGSATPYVNFFDPEIVTIFGIKSPRTAIEKRINDLSYGIKLNRLVYERAVKNQNISLFSIRKSPMMNKLFYGKNYEAFKLYYETEEALGHYSDQINARDFLKMFSQETFETSSYYPINIDEINSNTPYEEEISQSNICVEFMTPTRPLSSSMPNDPAIGICVLGNINQGLVSIEELPRITRMMVLLQTSLALRQNHPTPQANAFVRHKRDIGIGFSNHAYWLAINGWRYGQKEALEAHDEWMEHFAYGMIDASCDLVDVFGIAPDFNLTNWREKMPMDRYKKTVDELVNRPLSCDWDTLRSKVKVRGMANCGLMMVPPSESSSIGSNQISSLEPLKDLLTIKDRKGVNIKQYAPDPLKLADKYDYAYDRPITKDFLKHVCVTQKWIDKGISANRFYSPMHYSGEKIPMSEMIEDLIFFYYYGGKTLYYQNTDIKDSDIHSEPQGCEGGGCSV